MLSLGKVRRSGIGYYFAAVGAQRDGLVEADGRWLGSLAGALQLGEGAVEEHPLRALLEGVDPSSGEILDARHARVRVVAFDAVFAAPKSVSILHALGPPQLRAAIGEVHEASVAAVVTHLEPDIALVRRSGSEGRRTLPATGVVAAAFVHRTSRAPDPHLHSHVVLANLARDQTTGRWSALDGRALFEQRKIAGALYGSELRRGLADRLGLDFHVRRPGVIDVVGVSDRVITAFSRRLREIEAERTRTGLLHGRAARLVADHTRAPKDLTTSYETLVEGWREEAYRLGVSERTLVPRPRRDRLDMPRADRSPLAASGTHAVDSGAPGGEHPRSNAVALEQSAPRDPPLGVAVGAALGSFDRPFLRRDLVAAIAGRVVDGARSTDLEAAADAALVSSAIDDAPLVWADASRPWTRVPPVGFAPRFITRETAARLSEVAVARAAAPRLGRFVSLDEVGQGVVQEQPVGLVVGPDAGPLDTLEMLRALREDAQRRGRRVIGVAPHAALAAHLQGLTGIVAGGVEELPLPRHGDLVVVIGASRCAPRANAALIERSRASGSSVVLVDVGPQVPSGSEILRRDVSTPRRSHALTPCSETVSEGGLRSLFASRLCELNTVLETACGHVEASGRRPVIVLADRTLGDELGVQSVPPGAALRLERSDPAVGLVLVGGQDVLPEPRHAALGGGARSVVSLAGAPQRLRSGPGFGRTVGQERLRDRSPAGRSLD